MSYKLLKIELNKVSYADPETNVWNIFDSEHPPYMHYKRKTGEGMDPSFILFENNDFNVTLDTQRLPIFSFIQYRSIMVHIATEDNSVVQYSSFFGVPTLQRYSAVKNSEGLTDYKIQIVFYLSGFWKLLSPVIRKYVSYWLQNTWQEDLVMKERRHKFLQLGFRDMIGMPSKISERKGKRQKLKLPLPRVSDDVDNHPFCWRNLKMTLGHTEKPRSTRDHEKNFESLSPTN